VRKNQREAKSPDYSKYSKEKVIQILSEREKEHKKIENFYRTQVDELEAELSDARELIISLFDERNDVDIELAQVWKQRQDFKSQLQSLEIELSRKTLEKGQLLHNFELANIQIHRLEQQLQEEQQKIDILNTQNISLTQAVLVEKAKTSEVAKDRDSKTVEIDTLNKVLENMQVEINQLQKQRDFSENLTDKKLQDAIAQLSMIILAKNKSYKLTPEQRYLISQVFGENCSKIFESLEAKGKELNQKIEELNVELEKTKKIIQRQEKEMEEMRKKNKDACLVESELRKKLNKKNARKFEAIKFLQCQAAMNEELIRIYNESSVNSLSDDTRDQ
jgi:chromosome segregation ATPase